METDLSLEVHQNCPAEWSESECEGGARGPLGVGVVLGGRARGWLPDVAAVMWRRMLAALGDPNLLQDPSAHLHAFQHLVGLNATLLTVSTGVYLHTY